MSRLGTWQPKTAEERLDRLDSLAEIQQLPVRYALCVDSRDMDTMVSLFVPDVRVGRDSYGREALREWFVDALSRLVDTVHFVGNHIIDFDGPDQAHGIVYCHDEVVPRGEERWNQGMLQYWDTYRRIEGPEGQEWCFERRKYTRWYMADWTERPSHAADTMPPERRHHIQLPEAFDSWGRFWSEVGVDPYASGAASA
jgi:hypothetical protein